MSGVETRAVTAEELLRRSEDGARQELINGEVRDMAPAGAEHGAVALHIGALLQSHLLETGSGRGFAAETGFLLASSPDTVRAPDVAVVTREHAERVGRPTGYWPGAPDLAVEVVSPNDTYSDVESKALHWLSAGCELVLVVDPATRRVTMYRSPTNVMTRAGADPVNCEPALPGFAPVVSDLFPAV